MGHQSAHNENEQHRMTKQKNARNGRMVRADFELTFDSVTTSLVLVRPDTCTINVRKQNLFGF